MWSEFTNYFKIDDNRKFDQDDEDEVPEPQKVNKALAGPEPLEIVE